MFKFFKFLFKSVTTTTVEMEGSFGKGRLDEVLQQLLWEKNVVNSAGSPMEILRLKVLIIVEKRENCILGPGL